MILSVLLAIIYWEYTPVRSDLILVNRGDVFTLDPQRMSYVQDFRMAYALYEGLVRWNNDDLSIEPAAAVSLPEISDDQLIYTFHLRPDASWSNGDPVTAHDFVYSWKRLLWPDTAADYSNLLFVIEGAEEFFRWRSGQLADFTLRPHASTQNDDAWSLFEQASAHFENTVGLRVIDDLTLQIKLRRPVPYFLDVLCFAPCYPVHRPTVEGWLESQAKNQAPSDRGWIGVAEPSWNDRRWVRIDPLTGRLEQKHQWARPSRLVSNGPYVLAEWRYKRDIRLEKNPAYHSPHLLRNQSVLMMTMEDANTSVLAFESGQVDWLGEVAVEYQADILEQRRRYEGKYRDQIDSMLASGMTIDESLGALPEPEPGERRNIHAYPAFGTDFYSFNCRPRLADGRPNPFADAAVRRAFAITVDKTAIVQIATRLNEPVMNTLIPPGSIPGYQSPLGLGRDIMRARAELASAGWIDRNRDGLIENQAGEPFPIIDLLWTSGSSRYKWMSLELKSQWERELGVRIELRSADAKFYKEDIKLGKFMIARGRWYGDYSDPTTFLEINRTGDGNNDRGFSDARFDSMMEAAQNEREAGKRMRLLETAEQYLMEEQAPLVPICQLVQLYMYEPGKLKGLSSHPRLIQYLWQMEVMTP